MINKESARRPEQVKRYEETLKLLKDRAIDNGGNQSIYLSKKDAKELARLAKEGSFKTDDCGVTAPELLTFEMAIKA